MYPENVKQTAKTQFEKQHQAPRSISTSLGIPLSTVYSWIKKEGWQREEETPETVALQELKRIMAKKVYSRDDLKKIKALRLILDEYACNRSQLAGRLQETIEFHRQNNQSKLNLIDDLIALLNQTTGSTLKPTRKQKSALKPNDFREVFDAG